MLNEIIESDAFLSFPDSGRYRDVLEQLEQTSPEGLSNYYKRLKDNLKVPDKLHDFLFEGRAALMFIKNGFQVELRERPDLRLILGSSEVYAEVKHFHTKEQDRLDQERLANHGPTLEPYGDTVPTEGKDAWEQVFDVVKRKLTQFINDAPNLLVIGSDSPHAIDDSIIPTAINMIDEAANEPGREEFRKLNGIILITSDCTMQGRRVYFFPTQRPLLPLPDRVMDVLEQIRYG